MERKSIICAKFVVWAILVIATWFFALYCAYLWVDTSNPRAGIDCIIAILLTGLIATMGPKS
jgi:hypothetical protein